MTSLYDMTVPIFVAALENFRHFLSVGEKYANEHGIEHQKFMNARLIDDMNVRHFLAALHRHPKNIYHY